MAANDDLFDEAIRHQIAVRRFQAGEVRRVLQIVEKSDRALAKKLRARLARLGNTRDVTSARVKALLEDVRALRGELMSEVRRVLVADLSDLAKVEAAFERRALEAHVPIAFEFAAASAQTLREAVYRRPFQGRLLRDWFGGLAAQDRRLLEDAVRQGVAEGESIPQIVARVAGTRGARFTDGALAATRRSIEAVVRTAVNHVTNSAREAVWEANADVIYALRWTSTLDGRTSPVCRARDGKLSPVGDSEVPKAQRLVPAGARPPAHVNCRSVMVAVLDAEGLVGERPFVVDTRTGRERQVDFRAMAREQGRPVREVRAEWARRNVGQVPAETTYNQFLKRQPAAFQDQVLGRTRGRLFRSGNLEMDQFVDRKGAEYTLSELARQHPGAFERAGLDPQGF